ncbi:phage tail protein [Escherichia coli]
MAKIVTPLKDLLSGPLTQAFEDARDHIIAAEMPKQLGYALKQQLRLWARTHEPTYTNPPGRTGTPSAAPRQRHIF